MSKEDHQRIGILYNVKDVPPVTFIVGFAVQFSVNMISSFVSMTAVLSAAICASPTISAKLFSTMGLMSGLTTFLQGTLGFRLPLSQGPSIVFVFAVVERYNGNEYKCSNIVNSTMNNGSWTDDSVAEYRLQQTILPLVAASVIHILLAFSGIIGYLSKFVGPVTVVPALLLLAFNIIPVYAKFISAHWGIATLTVAIAIITTTYMSDVRVPLPSWNRSIGCHVTKSNIIRLFGITISVGTGWFLCYILTATDSLSSNPADKEYEARTDHTGEYIDRAPWFNIPHIGQFGPARFDARLFVGYIVAVLVSILDSMADYKITGQTCRAPDPPPHAINRGLFVEGMCSLLSGFLGGGHATTTYTGIIGMMVLSGNFSRITSYASGISIMAMSVFGKIAAFFVSLPKPVLGGIGVVKLASLIGSLLCNLQEIDMSRPRNNVAVGIPIILGYTVSRFVKANLSALDTGMPVLTQVLTAILGNPMLVAGCLGCFLDNTLPGKENKSTCVNGEKDGEIPRRLNDIHVYDLPVVTTWLNKRAWTRFIPILPAFGQQ